MQKSISRVLLVQKVALGSFWGTIFENFLHQIFS